MHEQGGVLGMEVGQQAGAGGTVVGEVVLQVGGHGAGAGFILQNWYDAVSDEEVGKTRPNHNGLILHIGTHCSVCAALLSNTSQQNRLDSPCPS